MSARTICAIATPPGQGGVGIVRISGPEAERVLRALCPSLADKVASHHLHFTRARHPTGGDLLDEVLVTLMRAPHSYTGEDVAEIHGHGGWLNMRRLLEATCDAGASPAGPGEFTQRAFLNGRLDLTQAEAVADIIGASSHAALQLAQHCLSGRLGGLVEGMREDLIAAVTLTEAAIDFSTEEHVYQLDIDALQMRLGGLQAQIKGLLGTWDAGRQAREGVRVVLLGRPNAGKSTLFNRLCGESRAIVTDIPGTTRDYLEEQVVVEGVALRLIDTAGLRDARDEVERLGVDRTLDQADSADLILWVIDTSRPLELDPKEAQSLTRARDRGADIMAICNKVDLPQALGQGDIDRIEGLAGHTLRVCLLPDGPRPESLFERLAQIARERLQPAQEGAAITRQRHRDALSRALEALERAAEAVSMGMSHEFIALDLRIALDAVGEITGRVTVDDVLNRIFSSFCVGK